MNKIYWDNDKISIITDQMEAVEHKHWAMQLFLSMDKDLRLRVSGKQISCKCVIVNQNVNHSFSTDQQIHLSVIIMPATNISEQLKRVMDGREYYILDDSDVMEMQKLVSELIYSAENNIYYHYVGVFHRFLGIGQQEKRYDDRIEEVLRDIECCDCGIHRISAFADKVSISPDRLSHLFREQVGMPLKSYIQLHQMQKAFRALCDGRSITEAAMQAGFDTPSHFAAVTKRMMGIPASVSLKNSVFLKV